MIEWLTKEKARSIPAKEWKKAVLASFENDLPMDPAFMEGWLGHYAPKEVQESWK